MKVLVNVWVCLLLAWSAAALACTPYQADLQASSDLAFQNGVTCAQSVKGKEEVDAAFAWYQVAAERGHARAMYNLGLILANRGEPESAQTWFQRAALQGHPGAQYRYGLWLLETNPSDAVPWLRKAAESEHVLAQIKLGDAAMLKQDYSEAYKWYQAAWVGGHLPAHQKQLLAYQRIEMEKRIAVLDTALAWMDGISSRADAAMTCSDSCLAGGMDSMAGEHTTNFASRDDRMWKTARLYCTAARLGSTEPLYHLGMLYLVGAGVPSRRETAAALFQMAGDRGHQESLAMLTTLGDTQQGTPPACILANVDPEKKPSVPAANLAGTEDWLQGHEWVAGIVESIAKGKGVDPRLVMAVIRVESGFNHKAVSDKNAMGLMQLIPDTAVRFNVKNAFDVAQNVKGGVAYLKWLLERYSGDLEKVLAAYNAGEGNVDRYKGIPPFKETREYVKRVLGYFYGSSRR